MVRIKTTVSLKKNHEFRRLYARGKTRSDPYLAVYCRRNGRADLNRLGITVGTKIGGAVQRNRLRRRLREAYRINESRLRLGYDLVIVGRVRASHAEFQRLERSLLGLLDGLGMLNTDEKAAD